MKRSVLVEEAYQQLMAELPDEDIIPPLPPVHELNWRETRTYRATVETAPGGDAYAEAFGRPGIETVDVHVHEATCPVHGPVRRLNLWQRTCPACEHKHLQAKHDRVIVPARHRITRKRIEWAFEHGMTTLLT